LPEGWAAFELNDSKKLTPEKREKIFSEIQKNTLGIGVGQASPGEIDEHNIYRATQLAMGRAIVALDPTPDFLLTDAMPLPEFSSIAQKPIVHGDALSASIAAASIIAKVTRDRMMEELHQYYPEYGFASHKGYGTEEHLRAIQKHGVCPEHRLSFGPVAQAVIRNTAQGPMVFWKQRLESAKNSQELEQIGFQLKRIGAADLKESELGTLREVYRQKKTDWDQGNK
jgi:ribonuclease HII